jgi:hypothetical protein
VHEQKEFIGRKQGAKKCINVPDKNIEIGVLMRNLKLNVRTAARVWSFSKTKKNGNVVIAAGWC